jgi:colanic acid biosynthesis glycosyl transferase WcaI
MLICALGVVRKNGLGTQFVRWLDRRIVEHADLVSVTTPHMQRQIAERYGLQKLPAIIPNGVDAERFATTTTMAPWIIFVGNIGLAQEFNTLLDALPRLLKLHPAVRLKIVGDGDCLDELRRNVAEKRLNANVDFLGVLPRPKASELMCNATVGIALLRHDPSLEYAVPTKAYEYAAAGIPFVVSDLAESRMFAHASQGGFVNAWNASELAETLIWIFSNPGRAKARGLQARAFVEAHYSRAASAQKLIDLWSHGK